MRDEDARHELGRHLGSRYARSTRRVGGRHRCYVRGVTLIGGVVAVVSGKWVRRTVREIGNHPYVGVARVAAVNR